MLLSRTQGIPEGDHLMRSRNREDLYYETFYNDGWERISILLIVCLFSRDRYDSVISYGVPSDPSWILWYLYRPGVHLLCTFSSLFRRRYSVVKYFLLVSPSRSFCPCSSLLI